MSPGMRLKLFVAVAAVALQLQGQSASDTVAVVGGRSITLADVDRSIEARLRPLQQQMYALRKSALENLVVSAVLEQTAAKRSITVAELRKQLSAGTFEIAQADIDDMLEEHAESFAGMSPDEVRERVRLDLESQERMRHYREGVARLRDAMAVEVLLREPTVTISTAGFDRVAKGKQNAPVTLIEFADFQCPYCRGASATVNRVAEQYKDDVRVVFRHLPLGNHPEAFGAARAAHCASEQNRFWEYHDALFEADALSADRLRTIAADLKLDTNTFASCMADERSKSAVLTDLQEAKRLGITGTPTFIVNGVLLTGAVPFSELQQILDKQLATAAPARIAP